MGSADEQAPDDRRSTFLRSTFRPTTEHVLSADTAGIHPLHLGPFERTVRYLSEPVLPIGYQHPEERT